MSTEDSMIVLTKLFGNITGVTLGCGFLIVGLFVFEDPSVLWLKNLFIFFGIFIILLFMSRGATEYVRSLDPNYGRVTDISRYEEQSLKAVTKGKAMAFDLMTWLYVLMLVAFSLLEAEWPLLAILLGSYAVCKVTALAVTAREYRKMWRERL